LRRKISGKIGKTPFATCLGWANSSAIGAPITFRRPCLKKHYRGSPVLAAMDLFPNFAWEEWKFQKLFGGFWNGIQAALSAGFRGLPGGMMLPRLLREHGLKAGHQPPSYTAGGAIR
jgi:hypothetical protein